MVLFKQRCNWMIGLAVQCGIAFVAFESAAYSDEQPANLKSQFCNVWARPLADLDNEKGRTALSLMAQWESNRQAAGLPLGSALTGLIVGERLVYRDLHCLRVVDLASGKILVSHPYNFPLVNGSAFSPVFANRQEADSWLVRNLIVGNSFNGLLATDGRRVYFNESARWGYKFRALAAIELAQRGEMNRMPGWRLESAQRLARDPPPSPEPTTWGHSFLGVPLAHGEHVFCLSEAAQKLYLNCFSADSAALIWRQTLEVNGERSTESTSYSLSLSDNILVCQTHREQLVGIDPDTGQTLWRGTESSSVPTLVWSNPNGLASGYPSRHLIHHRRVFH